jgi:hypothetical protein
MWFVVASALLVLVYVVLKPLGDGLMDTSAWAAKMMAPPGTGDNDFTKQYLRVAQAALMDGWLSNVPFFSYNAVVAASVFAALYHWWAAPIVFVVAVFTGTLTKMIWGRSVTHYLLLMHGRLLNRAATYRQKNDNERAEAAESTASELQEIIVVYMNTSLRPPTAKQLKAMPYGDVNFYLKDDSQAWLRMLAEQGSAEAQYVIGGWYYQGRGLSQDYAEAALWFHKASVQGYAEAQHALGRLYYEGHGVPQDYTQAAAWYRKAAEQGNAVVQAALGSMYYSGLGVLQDCSEAYFWLDLGAAGELDASQSKQVAQYRDDAASHLTPADLSREQERARKWFEAHPAKPQ